MSKKLISIVMGAAILGASAAAVAQTTTAPKSGDTMPSQSATTQYQVDFKVMDTNADGMITREEYVAYYGGRFERMKRNDKGMVMMNDMMIWDGGRNNPTSDTPTKANPGVKGGAGAPKATGGG
jgi:hypothetical protein